MLRLAKVAWGIVASHAGRMLRVARRHGGSLAGPKCSPRLDQTPTFGQFNQISLHSLTVLGFMPCRTEECSRPRPSAAIHWKEGVFGCILKTKPKTVFQA